MIALLGMEHGMTRIDRPSVCTDVVPVSLHLFALLVRVVAFEAQRLQWTQPEPVDVTTMGNDMIRNTCRNILSTFKTSTA